MSIRQPQPNKSASLERRESALIPFEDHGRGVGEVERASTSNPASLSLERAYNDYVRRAILADGTEAGIISCRDGSSSRYWFRSHHLTRDDGGGRCSVSATAQKFSCQVTFAARFSCRSSSLHPWPSCELSSESTTESAHDDDA
jgi:hypothetical protein